jgi:hypothetical protein
LPRDRSHAVEAKQSEFRAQPDVPIGGLGN